MSDNNQVQELVLLCKNLSSRLDSVETENRRLTERVKQLEVQQQKTNQEQENVSNQIATTTTNSAPGLQAFLQKINSRIVNVEGAYNMMIELARLSTPAAYRICKLIYSNEIDEAVEFISTATRVIFRGDKTELVKLSDSPVAQYMSKCFSPSSFTDEETKDSDEDNNIEENENERAVLDRALKYSENISNLLYDGDKTKILQVKYEDSSKVAMKTPFLRCLGKRDFVGAIRIRDMILANFGVDVRISLEEFHDVYLYQILPNCAGNPRHAGDFVRHVLLDSKEQKQIMKPDEEINFDKGFDSSSLSFKLEEVSQRQIYRGNRSIVLTTTEKKKFCQGLNMFMNDRHTCSAGLLSQCKPYDFGKYRPIRFPSSSELVEALSHVNAISAVDASNVSSIESLRAILKNVKNMVELSFHDNPNVTDEWVKTIRQVGHQKLQQLTMYSKNLKSIDALKDAKKSEAIPKLEEISVRTGVCKEDPYKFVEGVFVRSYDPTR